MACLGGPAKPRQIRAPAASAWTVLGLILVVSWTSGCSMYTAAARNLVCEPVTAKDNFLACLRDRKVAAKEWQCVKASDPEHAASKDYEAGFKDGVIDFIEHGGTTAPRPMPPKRYFSVPYALPEGKEAVVKYYAGYQHGANVARERGYHDLVLVKTTGVGVLIKLGPDSDVSTPRTETMRAGEALQAPKADQATPPEKLLLPRTSAPDNPVKQ